jgi:hypothetical protein
MTRTSAHTAGLSLLLFGRTGWLECGRWAPLTFLAAHALVAAVLLGGCAPAPERVRPVAPGEVLFTHEEPDFTIRFAASWSLRETSGDEYLHVAAGKGVPNIIVGAAELPEQPDVQELAQRNYEGLRSSQGFGRGDIVDARSVTLEDGTPGYETLIHWRHPLYRVELATLYLLARRGDTALKVVATDLGRDLSDAHRRWCYSLHIE